MRALWEAFCKPSRAGFGMATCKAWRPFSMFLELRRFATLPRSQRSERVSRPRSPTRAMNTCDKPKPWRRVRYIALCPQQPDALEHEHNKMALLMNACLLEHALQMTASCRRPNTQLIARLAKRLTLHEQIRQKGFAGSETEELPKLVRLHRVRRGWVHDEQ